MTPPTVFISYSHEDEEEKNELLEHLGVLRQSANSIDVWSDDRIGAGEAWKQEINQAMAKARVAILLISKNFLNSEFISKEEVPNLLERREKEGVTVFPVIAKFSSKHPILFKQLRTFLQEPTLQRLVRRLGEVGPYERLAFGEI